MKRAIGRINRFFAELSGWLLSAIMFLFIIDFVSRGLYNPIQGVTEMAVFVLVAVVYLGIPHTEGVQGHVRVEVFLSKFSPPVRNTMNVIIFILAVATAGFVVYAVAENALKSFLTQEAVAGTVPLLVWPVKTVIVIGCFFYLVQLIINTMAEFHKITRKSR